MNPKPSFPILIITSPDNGQVDGVSTFCKSLSEGLAKSGNFDIYVVTPSPEVETLSLIADSNSDSLHHYRCPMASGSVGIGQYIKHLSDGQRCAVLLNYWPSIFNIKSIRTNMPNASIIQIVHDLPWLSVFTGNPDSFFKSYDADFSEFSETERKFLKYSTYDTLVSFQNADHIVCLCNDTMNIINQNYQIPIDKIHLIPNGLPDKSDATTIEVPLLANQLNVLFVGRPTISKGWDRVVMLANHFKKNQINATITCAGFNNIASNVPKDLISYFIESGIVTQQKLYELYHQTDFVFIPSRHEQCSYVGIEAMMLGAEIVAFESFGVRNMFDNQCACIIDSVDKFPLHSPGNGAKARNRYLNSFAHELMIRAYDQLLSRLVFS